jgi:hypothetical protein
MSLEKVIVVSADGVVVIGPGYGPRGGPGSCGEDSVFGCGRGRCPGQGLFGFSGIQRQLVKHLSTTGPCDQSTT